MRVVGDRQNHGGQGNRDQLGIPGLECQQSGHAHGTGDQRAESREPGQATGDAGFVSLDVDTDQRE